MRPESNYEKSTNRQEFWQISAALFFSVTALGGESSRFPDTIEKIKPAMVAVGTFQKTRLPPLVFRGTGFVVADGRHVITDFISV